jgi:hypothetical protein
MVKVSTSIQSKTQYKNSDNTKHVQKNDNLFNNSEPTYKN